MWLDSLADRPGASFPKALDDTELEGAYRFFGNVNVSPDAILSPHFRQTAQGAAAHEQVRVIDATT
jgi:Transposase DNA-binding